MRLRTERLELWVASHSGILTVRSQQWFPSASSQAELVTGMADVGTHCLPSNTLQLGLHGSLKAFMVHLRPIWEHIHFQRSKNRPSEQGEPHAPPSLSSTPSHHHHPSRLYAKHVPEAAVSLCASGWYSSTAYGLQHTQTPSQQRA